MNYICRDIKTGDWEKITPKDVSPRIYLGSFWTLPKDYYVNDYPENNMHLILIIHGEILFTANGTDERKAKDHDMIALFPGTMSYRVTGGKPASIYQVGFFPAPPPLHQGVPFVPEFGFLPDKINTGDSFEFLISQFEEIISKLVNPTPLWQSFTSARLLDIINCIFMLALEQTKIEPTHMGKWSHAIGKLEDYQNPPDIQELAKEMHMSTEHFIREFKKFTGLTPKTYFQETRLWKARQMLKQGVLVKQAAYKCGFSDQLYFSRLFKKYFGIPPSRISADNIELAPEHMGVPISRNFFAPGVTVHQVQDSDSR